MFRDKSFTEILPVISRLPVIVEEPLTIEDPVKISVSTAENVELPETENDPLTMAPLDDVMDDRCASLPLTISFFQVANYYSTL